MFIVLFLFTTIGFENIFAESKSLSIPARSYEQVQIYLNQGDELRYSIGVSGGTNDDIDLTIFMPDGDDQSGFVYEEFSGSFIATSSGTYVFSFDNTFSLLSNKFVSFSYERTQNTFYIYVEDLPSYADYASNVVSDATEYWKDGNPELNFYKANSEQNSDLRIQWVKDFGVEHVGFAVGSFLIEVGLGDSNCKEDWQPYSADHVSYIMKHEIGHVLGLEHTSDANNIMYPIVQKTEWGLVEQEFSLTESYSQFVSFCSMKDVTAFRYSVEVEDPTYGFDVYVVPSVSSSSDWSVGEPFQYYSDEECFGENYRSYNGNCQGVRNGAGLMVIMPDKLTEKLTEITIQYEEIPLIVSREQSISLKYPPEPEIIIPEIIPIQPQQNSLKELLDNRPKTEIIICVTGTVLKNGICVLDKCGIGTTLKNGFCVPDPKIQSKGGGCLIATATFGSELSSQVQQLRELRDNKLLQTESGSSFMTSFNELYYSFSPTIADLERQSPIFKEVVKLTITPLILSLSILNYVDMDSEAEVLGYGIGLIALNVGMYFVAPVGIIVLVRKSKNS